MIVNTKMNEGIHEIYAKYGKSLSKAHIELIDLERRYKSRIVGDNKKVSFAINEILEGLENDN